MITLGVGFGRKLKDPLLLPLELVCEDETISGFRRDFGWRVLSGSSTTIPSESSSSSSSVRSSVGVFVTLGFDLGLGREVGEAREDDDAIDVTEDPR